MREQCRGQDLGGDRRGTELSWASGSFQACRWPGGHAAGVLLAQPSCHLSWSGSSHGNPRPGPALQGPCCWVPRSHPTGHPFPPPPRPLATDGTFIVPALPTPSNCPFGCFQSLPLSIKSAFYTRDRHTWISGVLWGGGRRLQLGARPEEQSGRSLREEGARKRK